MSADSRGGKREEEHEEHENHEAWVIPYADMLTLLMCLFLVLFAVGNVDKQKFEKMADSMRSEFGGAPSSQVVSLGDAASHGPLSGGESLFDSVTPITAPPSVHTDIASDIGAGIDAPSVAPVAAPVVVVVELTDEVAARKSYADLAALELLVRDSAESRGLGDTVGFRFENRGLVVSIITDQVLFTESSADLQPIGVEIVELVADVLRASPNDISIEGHTDSRPISSGRFPSNWELSTARATSVLRHLTDVVGFDPARLSAAGYADTRPLASNDTIEGAARNRRVEVVVTSDVSLAPILEPDA